MRLHGQFERGIFDLKVVNGLVKQFSRPDPPLEHALPPMLGMKRAQPTGLTVTLPPRLHQARLHTIGQRDSKEGLQKFRAVRQLSQHTARLTYKQTLKPRQALPRIETKTLQKKTFDAVPSRQQERHPMPEMPEVSSATAHTSWHRAEPKHTRRAWQGELRLLP